jgi:hypothetical protein
MSMSCTALLYCIRFIYVYLYCKMGGLKHESVNVVACESRRNAAPFVTFPGVLGKNDIVLRPGT